MKKNVLIMILVVVVTIGLAFGIIYLDATFRLGSAAYSISNS